MKAKPKVLTFAVADKVPGPHSKMIEAGRPYIAVVPEGVRDCGIGDGFTSPELGIIHPFLWSDCAYLYDYETETRHSWRRFEKTFRPTRMKHEVLWGQRVAFWDDGEKAGADRYTAVFIDDVDERGNVAILAMSASPFHPQGVGMHGEMKLTAACHRGRGGVFAKRLSFADLPPDCQKAVLQDCKHDWACDVADGVAKEIK